MATERHQHAQWAQSQYDALVELGVSPIDAQKRIDWILANLPDGEDPATYIFPPNALWQDPAAPDKEQDSAAAFIASDDTPNKYKRLLHSREEN